MSRYGAMFEQLRERGEGAFGVFVMLGDPALGDHLIDELIEAGADMIEVGIPFSDPVADGPVIQAAAKRALEAGIRVGDCLERIAALRSRHSDLPIGILTYANIVVARGGFMRDAADAGADSLLIADIPALEAEPYVREMEQVGLEPVLIAAPNTPEATVRQIASLSKAYTYCVSRPGITGTHAEGAFDRGLTERLETAGAPPPVFGFGISQPGHVRAAGESGAAGIICGSAIVEAAARGGDVVNLVHLLKMGTFRDKGRNDSGAQ